MQFKDIIFKIVRYANDYVWAFDIPGTIYHGYSQDKKSNFHVYQPATNSYNTYGTIPDFEAFLQQLKPGNYQTQYTHNQNLDNGLRYNKLPVTDVGGFNATPLIILGAVGLITWLWYQK